jgi:hypothetical protein
MWLYRAGKVNTLANTSQSTKKQTAKDTSLETVLKAFNSAWEYTSSSWHQRWQNNHYLYNGQRTKRGYEGITDTFVPMTFGTVETLVSALFGSKPKYTFLPPQDKPDQKTDILNAMLDYYWDKDQWSVKNIAWGRSMLKLGNGIAYYSWDNDHPTKTIIPLRDFFIDPSATSLEDAGYMGRRFLTTVDELRSFEIVDLDKVDELGNPTGEMKKKYKNLDKIKQGKTGDNTDKQEKDMWYGSTVKDAENTQVEVIEYWTEDDVISVVNRSTVIEDTTNYFKAKAEKNGDEYPCGILPFADLRDYVDESLYYAKGEIDFIADQQELLNDITNQNNDAITYTLNQMYTLDPKYAHMIEEIENLPGAVYPVGKDALMPIPQRPIPPDAFNERQNIKNEIRETTASNEVVRGVKSDANATATEINAQIAGAGQRINLKITQVENGGFYREAKTIFALIKLYVTEPQLIRIVGKDGAKWEIFDPSEYQGDYEPRVQLDIEVQQKKQKAAAEAKEMLAAFLNDPDINQQELKKLVLQRSFDLDPDEVETLVQPAPQMPMGDPGMPMDPTADPSMAPPMDAPMPMPEELPV